MPVATVPGKNGGRLLAGGKPGNKGGPGRPPQAFKNFLADMQRDPTVQEEIRAALMDRNDRNWKAALEVMVKFGPLDEGQQPMMTPEQAIEAVGRAFAEGLKRKKAAEKVAQGTPAKS